MSIQRPNLLRVSPPTSGLSLHPPVTEQEPEPHLKGVNSGKAIIPWYASALWRNEKTTPFENSFDDLLQTFEAGSGKRKEDFAKRLLKSDYKRGIEFFAARLDLRAADQNVDRSAETLLIVVRVLGEVPENFMVQSLETLERFERDLSRQDSPLNIKHEDLDRLVSEVLMSKVLLQTTAPGLFYKNARGYYDTWQEAAHDLEATIDSGKANSEDYGLLIELYLVHQRFDKARENLEELKDTETLQTPQIVLAYLEAEILIAEGKFIEAEEELNRHLAKAEDLPEIYAALGEIYLRKGQPERARQLFSKTHASLHGIPGMLLKIGETYLQRRQWKKAELLFQTQFNLIEKGDFDPPEAGKPTVVRAHDRLGVLYTMQGKWKEARGELEWALHYGPDNQGVLADLGLLGYKEGAAKQNRDEKIKLLIGARDDYNRALAAGKEEDYILFGRAQCLEKVGILTHDDALKAQAHQIFESLAYGNPPYVKGLLKLVDVYYWKGDYARMKKVAHDAVEQWPESFLAAYQLAEGYRMSGDYKEAKEEYKRAKQLAKAEGIFADYEVPLHFGIADCLVWLHQNETALHFLEMMHKRIHPSSPIEWERLCFIYLALRDKRRFRLAVKMTLEKGQFSKNKLARYLKDQYNKWLPGMPERWVDIESVPL